MFLKFFFYKSASFFHSYPLYTEEKGNGLNEYACTVRKFVFVLVDSILHGYVL